MKFSSPYHHATNGLVERQFRTIRDSIHITLKDKNWSDWVELLPEIEFMLNSTVQSTIKFSPAEVVFGKRISKEWCEEDTEKLNNSRDIIHSKINNNVTAASYDNECRISRTFKVGDIVLVKRNGAGKQEDRFEGPGSIIRKKHDRSYEIQFQDGRTVIRNVEWLKYFKGGIYMLCNRLLRMIVFIEWDCACCSLCVD